MIIIIYKIELVITLAIFVGLGPWLPPLTVSASQPVFVWNKKWSLLVSLHDG